MQYYFVNLYGHFVDIKGILFNIVSNISRPDVHRLNKALAMQQQKHAKQTKNKATKNESIPIIGLKSIGCSVISSLSVSIFTSNELSPT